MQATLHDLRELDAVDRIGSVLARSSATTVTAVDEVRLAPAGAAPVLGFGDVLLDRPGRRRRALRARDVAGPRPSVWRRGRPYADVAVEVMWPFVEGAIDRDDVRRRWSPTPTPPSTTPTCARCVELGDGLCLLELFWGPTLAFKDVALQLVGRLFDHELTARGERAHDRRWPPRATPARRPSRPARAATTLDIVVLHPAGG